MTKHASFQYSARCSSFSVRSTSTYNLNHTLYRAKRQKAKISEASVILTYPHPHVPANMKANSRPPNTAMNMTEYHFLNVQSNMWFDL